MISVKTTSEFDVALFRRAKLSTAARGQTFRRFVIEAIGDKLRREETGAVDKPWMQGFGALAKLKAETRRVDL